MESGLGAVVLASGLPLRPQRPTSFERQLRLLSTGLAALGYGVRVVGPEEAPTAAREPDVRGAILLGYPDQFMALGERPAPKAPLFLWAQCSKPPDPRVFDPCIAVPLTKKTEDFLWETGVARIGPVIPHGVDTVFFQPLDDPGREAARRSLGLGNGFLVGAMGANSFRKRFDLVIEAFSIFRGLRRGATLVIKTDRAIGLDGTDLRALAEKQGVEKASVIIEDELSDVRMRDLYGAMDVFVNLSEWEGFCLPAVEAMSMGVPVLTHDVQGPGELIPYDDLAARDSVRVDDGGSVLMRANPMTAAALLEKAASNPVLLRRLGDAGRAAAVRFDIRGIAESWSRLIGCYP